MTTDSYRVILTFTYYKGTVVAASSPRSRESALEHFAGFIADGGYGPHSHCHCKVVSDHEWVMSRLVAGAV